MKKVVNVKLEKKEWNEAMDKAFEKLNKKAKIDGFRPGKAPRSVFEKHYGKGDIIMEAADKIINDRYEGAIKESGIMPEIEPKIDLIKCDEEGLEFSYTFVAVSNVKLGEYKNLGVKKEVAKVTKEEIKHEIEHIVDNYAEIVEKDGKVKNGDITIIDFEGFKDGTPFEGGKAENYQLEIGSNSFIPGFEEGIIGMSKGEEKELKLSFPEDYHSEELKGQKVVFKVKVNEIKERVLPEMNEEFFEDLAMPGVQNKEDLEKEVETHIKEHKQHHIDEDYTFKVLDKAVQNMEIDLEDEMIEAEANAMYDDYMERLKAQGLNEEIYFSYANTTKEKMVEDMKKEAVKKIKYRYLLNEVIKKEDIKVSDKEANARVDELAAQYNIDKEQVIREFGNIEVIKYDAMLSKAVEVIKSNK